MSSINKKTINIFSCIITGLLFIFMITPGVYAKGVIGWVENVQVSPGNITIKAKIDTGAASSSLHCDCIRKIIRDGESWIQFNITDINGKQISVEKKIIRTVKIKRHFGGSQRRDVVSMGVCIGSHYEETDVSLIDRSGFEYDMLIGRKYLNGKFLVDSSAKFTMNPSCNENN